jgi:hypothetical protein
MFLLARLLPRSFVLVGRFAKGMFGAARERPRNRRNKMRPWPGRASSWLRGVSRFKSKPTLATQACLPLRLPNPPPSPRSGCRITPFRRALNATLSFPFSFGRCSLSLHQRAHPLQSPLYLPAPMPRCEVSAWHFAAPLPALRKDLLQRLFKQDMRRSQVCILATRHFHPIPSHHHHTTASPPSPPPVAPPCDSSTPVC